MVLLSSSSKEFKGPCDLNPCVPILYGLRMEVGFDHSYTYCIHFLSILKLQDCTLGASHPTQKLPLVDKGSAGNKPEDDALDPEGCQAG